MSSVNGIQVGRTENSRLVPIDSGKLAAELEKRGISKADASKKLMRSKAYFSNILWQNGVTKTAAEQIETVLGIPPQAYLLEMEKMEKEPEPETNSDLETTELLAHLSGVEQQLSRIADALEILSEAVKDPKEGGCIK